MGRGKGEEGKTGGVKGVSGEGAGAKAGSEQEFGSAHPLISTGLMSCCTRVLFTILATSSDSGTTACTPPLTAAGVLSTNLLSRAFQGLLANTIHVPQSKSCDLS